MHSGALPKAKRAAHLAERSRAQGQITRIPAPTAANSSPPINSLIHALMVHPPGRVKDLRWRVKPWETLYGRNLIVNKEMKKSWLRPLRESAGPRAALESGGFACRTVASRARFRAGDRSPLPRRRE